MRRSLQVIIRQKFVIWMLLSPAHPPRLTVSQQVEMNYIFSDNIRILYLSWYVKSPKETVKLSKKSRNKRCSYRFLLFPQKSALISIHAVTVSYRRSTWIRYQKTISWSVTKYNKKYPVNGTAQIEQVQDKKTVTGRRRNILKHWLVHLYYIVKFKNVVWQ